MGLVTTCVVLLLAASGIIARSRLNRATQNTSQMLSFKKLHKVFGWIMILVGYVTVSAGIYSYHYNRQLSLHLVWLNVSLFAATVFILECWHQWFIRYGQVKMEAQIGVDKKQEEDIIITLEQFERLKANDKGLLICLLNDLVLDVTAWADKHPGGRFLIEKTRGTDISKYFYGGYAYESTK